VHNVDRHQGSHDRHANAATLSDWASKLITLLFDQVEDQWKLRNEALQGHDRAENALFLRAILQAKAIRLYAYAGNLRAIDRPILSQLLTTISDLPNISLEAWTSQTEETIHSAASPMRMTIMYKPTQSAATFFAGAMARKCRLS
jgi:hypothetical protein